MPARPAGGACQQWAGTPRRTLVTRTMTCPGGTSAINVSGPFGGQNAHKQTINNRTLSRTTILSACAAVDSRCATKRLVRPAASCCSASRMSPSVRLSSAEVASSHSRIGASCAAKITSFELHSCRRCCFCSTYRVSSSVRLSSAEVTSSHSRIGASCGLQSRQICIQLSCCSASRMSPRCSCPAHFSPPSNADWRLLLGLVKLLFPS